MKKCIAVCTAIVIDEKVYTYSTTNYDFELCYTCQSSINLNNSTEEATRLYLSLKRRGVPAELEKYDGYKTIDIAVVDARVNIEVDGHQHVSNPKQALSDLKRTYFSLQKRVSHFKNSKRFNQRKPGRNCRLYYHLLITE